MPPIVVLSQAGRGTGFARVAAGITRALAFEHEVHVVGLGDAAEGEPWVGHEHHARDDPALTSAAQSVVKATLPAVAVLVGQGEVIGWIAGRLRRNGFAGAIIAYVPMEGPVRCALPLVGLPQASVVVTYTNVAARVLADALATTASDGAAPDIAVIPHAVDAIPPTPMELRDRMRAELLPDQDPGAGPWLLHANRNDWRKRPELTMQAFAAVAERHPRARLVMHSNLRRRDLDLRVERARLGLEDRVILTRDAPPTRWSESRLSRLYACCEIGVSSTMAEGWGLVAFEHALHGAAQVMPRHAALGEIWGDAPAWAPVGRQMRVDGVFDGAEPRVDALAAILLGLVERPEVARSVGQACERRARDPALSWDAVGAQWRTLVSEVLASRPSRRPARATALPNSHEAAASGSLGLRA
jgi:D-inositol-3-phosphate glycosyltransferase